MPGIPAGQQTNNSWREKFRLPILYYYTLLLLLLLSSLAQADFLTVHWLRSCTIVDVTYVCNKGEGDMAAKHFCFHTI